MKKTAGKLRLGIVGCGAIGSRIASSINRELKVPYTLSALYDIDADKAANLARRLNLPRCVMKSVHELIAASDVVVECVNTAAAEDIIKKSLCAKKRVLAMSVGRLYKLDALFSLARRKKCQLVLPSGAVAGLDGIKAARLSGLKSVTLTSRKPPAGFKGNAYLDRKGIRLDKISSDTVLFEGGVKEAVGKFPQNINVAAALAMAADSPRVKVRIIASPGTNHNSHEIVCESQSGSIRCITENVPCPDNPKTSYLAVLSGIQALKQLADQVKIGT